MRAREIYYFGTASRGGPGSMERGKGGNGPSPSFTHTHILVRCLPLQRPTTPRNSLQCLFNPFIVPLPSLPLDAGILFLGFCVCIVIDDASVGLHEAAPARAFSPFGLSRERHFRSNARFAVYLFRFFFFKEKSENPSISFKVGKN